MSQPAVDPAFKIIPRGSECFLIWRIENFAPVAVPKDKYGSFYDGDAYLVLSVKRTSGAFNICVHYWIGDKSTQDESGTVAIKAIELDDYLGGTPVQYREVQSHESKVFLNYFKSKGSIKYLPGGAASGFTHVDHTIKPRLLHVKGKNCPRIKELPIGWEHMNDGDAFVLDVGSALFVWCGKTCSRTERLKAMEFARKMRDDRGKGNIIVVEDGEESEMEADESELFQEYLPMKSKKSIHAASSVLADDAYERKSAAQLKLWKCSDEGGQLKVTEVAGKPLKKEMLDTNDTFIVDNGDAGIWVWCGRKSSSKEKKEAMTNALAFLTQRNYPRHVQVVKVHESGETPQFKALFKVWEKPMLPGQVRPHSTTKIAATIQTNFTASMMHDNPNIARDTGMVDDGTGKKVIHRVERTGNTYELKVVEKRYQDQLFGGDSYVILYTYLVSGKENYIIYFWLGRKSTQDERGVAAKKTVEMDDALEGAAKQVRIVQGKEPNHFMAMFGGKLIIYSGGKAGWGQTKDEGPGDTYLLHVRGMSQYNTKAEQVPLSAESLNSNDVFVLFAKSSAFIWAGKGSTGDEREMAKQLSQKAPKGYKLVSEGQEKDDFWGAIGGKKPYSSSTRLQVNNEARPPRLFQCSNASGAFTVNEIVEFSQEDVVTDDVFILDAYDNIFLWVGEDARPEEKTMAMDGAIEYLETDPSGRDTDTPIFIVKQGYEPPDFIGFFGVWDRDLWSGGKSYEELKKELGQKNVSLDRVRSKSTANGDLSFSDVSKFPIEVLQQKDELPDGVDKDHKEKHLSVEDFQTMFKVSYAQYIKLPSWKQQRLKKESNLW